MRAKAVLEAVRHGRVAPWARGWDTPELVTHISLWEVAMLVERGRRSLERIALGLAGSRCACRTVRIVPITQDIAADTAALPAIFHPDPADRLIVASCRVFALPLLTRDTRILRSKLVTRWTVRS